MIQKLINYVRSSKAELEKVSWPSRQDTIRYSALVLAVSAFVAIFFATLDFGLGQGVDALLARHPAEQTQPLPQVTPNVEAVTPSGQPADVKVTPGGETQGIKVTPTK